MVWDTRDVALADLSALPRAGMPKPPYLENWGDLTNHSSHASILPRSSSQYAGYWQFDVDRSDGKPEQLGRVIVTDPQVCERFGFTPGSTVLTPSGREAVVVGVVQTDPRVSDSWRLWAEYKGSARAASAKRSAREQTAAPGTPSSSLRRSAGGPRPDSGKIQWLPSGRTVALHASAQTHGLAGDGRSPSRPVTASPTGMARSENSRADRAAQHCSTEDASSRSIEEKTQLDRSLLPDNHHYEEGKSTSKSTTAVGESSANGISSHGFLLPARPIRFRRHRGREVFSPRVSYQTDTSCYVEPVKPPDEEIFHLEADFTRFSCMDEYREGALWWSPLGTVMKSKGVYVIPKAEDGYDHLDAASNPFSWLHHCQATAENSTDADRARLALQALAPEDRGRRRFHRGTHPMERSLMDGIWPRQPSSREPFQYNRASGGEELRWNLRRDQRRNGDPFIRKFAAEPPLWAPATGEVTRPELYLQQMGRLPYRGARMSSFPAAVATRCGHGPRTPVRQEDRPEEQSMAAQILAQRRPKNFLPVDGRSGLPKTHGWQKALLDPAALGHFARYETVRQR